MKIKDLNFVDAEKVQEVAEKNKKEKPMSMMFR